MQATNLVGSKPHQIYMIRASRVASLSTTLFRSLHSCTSIDDGNPSRHHEYQARHRRHPPGPPKAPVRRSGSAYQRCRPKVALRSATPMLRIEHPSYKQSKDELVRTILFLIRSKYGILQEDEDLGIRVVAGPGGVGSVMCVTRQGQVLLRGDDRPNQEDAILGLQRSVKLEASRLL